ncbi:MAG: SLC13/DASS family transporter [Bacteroidales bacterium]|nr:SLC13/DASS family transporter [Bacteroidales bacterium]
MSNSKFSVKYCVLLPIVLIITILLWALPVDAFGIAGLTVVQQRMIAIFVFAALMWMFEVIPNWTTSLLVIVVMLLSVSDKGLGFFCKPEYGTLVDYKSIMASFADPVVMLFLGGFVLAIIASKYGMDAAIAKVLLGIFGKKPKMVLLGFLIVIALFSMFMSNTATAAMMLAFLAPVLKSLPEDETGKVGLALAIPVSANLGGIGTPIGTPPNAIALGALENAGYQISFVTWMTRMVPYVIVMIAIAWVLLQVFFPFKSDRIELKIEVKQRQKTWKDYVAWITFFVTILLWVTESLTGINSNVVALIPLAVYTATGVFEKSDIKEINWSVLWLVAGGFALGTGLNKTGLAATLINAIPFSTMNVVVVMIIAGLICYLLSNFISNSATAALLVPILVVVGTAMSDPTAANNAQFMALGGMNAMIPFIAVCASIAMLLPISTPPNAIAASTGLVQTKDMSKVGIIIGAIGFVLGYFLLTAIFPFPAA